MTKTRFLSVFEHGLFQNITMNFGVLLEAALIILIVVLPPLHDIPVTATDWGGFMWVLPIAWAIVLVITEGRKWWTLKHPDGKVAEYFSW